jgi:signal transduction histidine kinase/CheY-like chemotaxis protein
MEQSRVRVLSLTFWLALTLAAVVPVYGSAPSNYGAAQVIRVGVDDAPPYQSWDPARGAVGFSVDVLNEAARSLGLHLEWVYCPEGPTKALVTGHADMWPLVSPDAVTPFGIYAAEPWLQNQYAVVWQKPSSLNLPPPSFEGKSVSAVRMPRSTFYARRFFPRSQLDSTPNRTVAFQHMCKGQSDATFMEVRLIEPMLLIRPPGCEAVKLGIRVFPDLSQPMTTVATQPFHKSVDQIRAEIDAMFLDGRFGALVDGWFVFSNIEAHSMLELRHQRDKNRYGYLALAAMMLVSVAILWMAIAARKAGRSAQRANEGKSRFLANVSHEVRTPMNGVLAMADLLGRTRLTDEQREYVETISESAGLQLTLLNDLLDSAKIEVGKLTLESIPFSPEVVCAELYRAFRNTARKKGLQLELHIGASIPAMMGDPLRLKQILSNLLNNALKFTPKGGVELTAEYAAECLTISVRDSGIGIPLSAQAMLFQKFTQADSSTTRRFGGTGLGLSICKDLTDLMGGSIQCESAAGEGTMFIVKLRLPLATEAIAAPQASTEERVISARYPILIVEDNLINQKVASAILRSCGLEFELAANGVEAVERYASGKYAAVLMDCHMPEMDGLEATRCIRAMDRFQAPIIALTAGAGESDRREALAAGMDDFLSKPVRRNELLTMLLKWLPPATDVREISADDLSAAPLQRLGG